MTKFEIESKLDRLAHLTRSIELLGKELSATREAAITVDVATLRHQADVLETAALDIEKVCRINQDIEHLRVAHAFLEAEIKADVLAQGSSGKGISLQAVYSPGLPSWDDAKLQGYAAGGHPEILGWRKVGQASVSFRATKGGGSEG